MKKTKIFYGNQFVEKFVCDGKEVKAHPIRSFIKFITLGSFVFMCVYTFGYVFTMIGAVNMPKIIEAKVIVEVPIKEIPPVMRRIAKCESGDTHFRNGQVIFNANSNGSVDRGRYQINSVWDKKATEMKLDLSDENDNEAFAMYLYENYGTEHWYSSKSCWK